MLKRMISILLSGVTLFVAGKEVALQEVRARIEKIPVKHRILSDFKDFQRSFSSRRIAPQFKAGILKKADAFLETGVLERKFQNSRIALTYSRLVLGRLTTLSAAYKLTGDARYARRAVQEMVKAASLPDWNPRHFLDTAELAVGVAVAFDWCRDVLAPEEEELIRQALVEKVVKASLDPKKNWWISSVSNWPQVCHAGVVAAALVISDREPELAAFVIHRAIVKIRRVMQEIYPPHGAYPEGFIYWSYGTGFNSLMIAMLEHALKTDFGLNSVRGWDETVFYFLSSISPSGKLCMFADSWPYVETDFPLYYLSWRLKRPDYWTPIAWKHLEDYCRGRKGPRLMPLAMFFLPEAPSKHAPTFYFSGKEAAEPLVFVRSSWERDALFFAIKGGDAALTRKGGHRHIDSGSFILDADGERWIDDLGANDYTKPEAAGITLWKNDQTSSRWDVFRIGEKSHNILLVDGKRPSVKGRGEILFAEQKADGTAEVVLDLSGLYPGQLKTYRRTAVLGKDRITVQDTITGISPESRITLQFCALGEIERGKSELHLLQRGKKLQIRTSQNGSWSVVPCSGNLKPYDNPNPHHSMLHFTSAPDSSGRWENVTTFLPVRQPQTGKRGMGSK